MGIGNDYSDSDKMSHLEKADLFVTVDSTKKLIGLGTINIATKPSAGNDYMLSEIDKDELTEYRQRVLAKIKKKLNANAQEWAEKLVMNENYRKSKENSFDPTEGLLTVVEKWLDGYISVRKIDYDMKSQNPSDLWSKMKNIGIGVAKDENGRITLVASYDNVQS